ncbi:putative reverse transcriptase domain-containing protein, partial [Tanacetum coccineum]
MGLTRHGEKDEPSISVPKPVNATTEFVDDTYFASDIPTDGPTIEEMVNATKDNFDEDDLVKFQELLLDAEKPLYEGCPDFTKLSAIVKLLNLKGKYGASDKFFNELLGLIKKMLPAGNEMVEKTYQAKKVMKLMGSRYKKIHIQSISEDLRWHATRRITDGVLRHPVDSQAWRTIDEKFPKITEDPRNLRLGLSADGVDVNTGNRHHSVWPVLIVIYNLPP